MADRVDKFVAGFMTKCAAANMTAAQALSTLRKAASKNRSYQQAFKVWLGRQHKRMQTLTKNASRRNVILRKVGFMDGFMQSLSDHGVDAKGATAVMQKAAETDPALAPIFNEWLSGSLEKRAAKNVIGSRSTRERISDFLKNLPREAYGGLLGATAGGVAPYLMGLENAGDYLPYSIAGGGAGGAGLAALTRLLGKKKPKVDKAIKSTLTRSVDVPPLTRSVDVPPEEEDDRWLRSNPDARRESHGGYDGSVDVDYLSPEDVARQQEEDEAAIDAIDFFAANEKPEGTDLENSVSGSPVLRPDDLGDDVISPGQPVSPARSTLGGAVAGMSGDPAYDRLEEYEAAQGETEPEDSIYGEPALRP